MATRSPIPFSLTFAEAVARLAMAPMVETRFERTPNDGATRVHRFPREQVVELLRSAPEGMIGEAGVTAQRADFGIYVPFRHHELGQGLLFLKTKPTARVSAAEIRRKEEEARRNHRASKAKS